MGWITVGTWELDMTAMVLALAVFSVTYWYVTGQPWKKFPPGPPSLPIVGSIPFLRHTDIRKALTQLAAKYGDVIKLDLGSESVIVLNGYSCIKDTIQKGRTFADRPPKTLGVDFMHNNGVALSTLDVSQKHRTFVLHQLKNFGYGKSAMEQHIREEVRCLVDELSKHDHHPVDPKLFFVKSSANVITSFAFGKRRSYEDPELLRLLELLEEINRGLARSSLSALLPWLKHFPGDPTGYYRRKATFHAVRAFCLEWIEERKKAMTLSHVPTDFIEAYLIEVEKRKDEPSTTFTEEQISWVMADLYAAGTDTVGNTVAWGVIFMVHHPDIQEKVYTEINDVIGSCLPKLEDRTTLPYTEAVISEIQRLGDLAPIAVPHAALEDTVLRGYHIPKGMTILPNLYSSHMDPRVWPDPERFDPGRFLDAGGQYRKREEFIPYSLGKRSCLGETLARSELFLTFTALMQHFHIRVPDGKPLPDTQGILGLVNHPKPYQVILESRT